MINVPGSLPQARLAELGVARVSFGPFIQRAALTGLAGLAGELLAGAALPDGIQPSTDSRRAGAELMTVALSVRETAV